MARKGKNDRERLRRRREWQEWRHRLTVCQRWRCFYCKQKLVNVFDHQRSATLDHYIPLSKGGADRFDNCVAACRICNQRKDNMFGPDFEALLRLEKMPASTVIIGSAFLALVATKVAKIRKDERSDERAMRAVAQLLRIGRAREIPEPIDPDQDATGDMPEKSPVRKALEDVQTRADAFGGAQGLRYPERWKARFHEARPDAPKRDWL
jgi:hypothetical protein